MDRCTRCGSSPVITSIEIHGQHLDTVLYLCTWCAGPTVGQLLERDEIDDVDQDLVHSPACRCDECAPTLHTQPVPERNVA